MSLQHRYYEGYSNGFLILFYPSSEISNELQKGKPIMFQALIHKGLHALFRKPFLFIFKMYLLIVLFLLFYTNLFPQFDEE